MGQESCIKAQTRDCRNGLTRVSSPTMIDFPPTTLRDLRVSYDLDNLTEDKAPADPQELFEAWLEDALVHQLPEPNAMTLGTIGLDGAPTARTVLLKGLDAQGFHFYTNYESRKGQEMAANPAASAVFLWTQRHHQVSIRGLIEKLPPAEATPAALAAWSANVVRAATTETAAIDEDHGALIDRIDAALTHPLLGIGVFLAIMAALFAAIFLVASVPMDC
jgi:hypothetical protein